MAQVERTPVQYKAESVITDLSKHAGHPPVQPTKREPTRRELERFAERMNGNRNRWGRNAHKYSPIPRRADAWTIDPWTDKKRIRFESVDPYTGQKRVTWGHVQMHYVLLIHRSGYAELWQRAEQPIKYGATCKSHNPKKPHPTCPTCMGRVRQTTWGLYRERTIPDRKIRRRLKRASQNCRYTVVRETADPLNWITVRERESMSDHQFREYLDMRGVQYPY